MEIKMSDSRMTCTTDFYHSSKLNLLPGYVHFVLHWLEFENNYYKK